MKKALFIVIILLIGLIVFNHIKNTRRQNLADKTIEQLYAKSNTYVTRYNEVVISKVSVTLERDKFKFLNDSLRAVVKTFKKPKDVIIYKWKVQSDTIHIKADTVYVNQPKLFAFNKKTEWYKLSGIVYENSITLNPVSIYNTTSIVTGIKKRQHYIDITNSNPYIINSGVTHFVVDHKKRWHEKWYITIPVGIVTGLTLNALR